MESDDPALDPTKPPSVALDRERAMRAGERHHLENIGPPPFAGN